MRVKNHIARISALMVVTFCFMTTVQAQPVRMGSAGTDPSPAVWSENLGEQLAVSLASPITEIKLIALEQTLYFASLQDPEIDLKATIPALEKIYRQDSDERCRMAAMAGLYATADDDAMIALRSGLHRQTSKSVQTATIGALMAHFGPDTFRDDDGVVRMARKLIEQYHAAPRLDSDKEKPTPIVAFRK